MLRLASPGRLLVVVLAYYVGARLGLRLALPDSHITPLLGDNLLTPALIAIGNLGAPLLTVTLLRRRVHGRQRRHRHLALLLDGLPLTNAQLVAVTWWTGDTVGALLVTLFLLTLPQLTSTCPTERRTT